MYHDQKQPLHQEKSKTYDIKTHSFVCIESFSLFQKDAALIEQLKNEKERLENKIESLESVYQEQLREVRQENFTLNAKVNFFSSFKKKISSFSSNIDKSINKFGGKT